MHEDWKDCYITFREPSKKEMEEVLDQIEGTDEDDIRQLSTVSKFLKDCFIEGKLFNGKKKVDMKKSDIDDLPFSIYQEAFDFLLTGYSQKTKNLQG